jgi:hypothetical protein
VKIIIDIALDVYTRLLEKLDAAGGEFKSLKRDFLIMGGQKSEDGELHLTVVGDIEKAKALLEFAVHNLPEAALPIATAIKLASYKL